MFRVSLSVGVMMLLAAAVQAQPPGDRPNRGGGPPGGFGGPPGFNLMAALDADKNGKISSQEIEGAVAALQKLDKDNDGKLSGKEIGWPPDFGGGFPGSGRGRGGFRGGGGRGGFPGGGFPGFGGQGGGRPQRPEFGDEASATSGVPPKRRSFFSVEQLQRLDRNDDGKITKEEIPQRMQELIFGRVDANKDEVIDKEELAKLGKAKE